jgi:sterol desaturase/sphingolipid hydroxylase (fatty acid hydroxylase superfamily)
MGDDQFDQWAGWLFEHAAQPFLYKLGLIGWDELAFDGITFFLYGAAQILLLYVLVRPLEALLPAEEWHTRKDTRVDVIYTLVTRLGIVPLALFFLLRPATTFIDQSLRLHNLLPWGPERLSPWLLANPLPSFFFYLVAIDFFNYWRHRLQHRLNVWWALHSLHHSQRMMSFWTDDRNHLLDDAISWIWFALVSAAIGVPPAQFVWLVAASRAVESLSHANVRFGFGSVGDRLLVSPKFHRLHHSVTAGKRGCNFATLFPIWDLMFRTADFRSSVTATGVADDQDYGDGYFAQQWLGFKRVLASLKSA